MLKNFYANFKFWICCSVIELFIIVFLCIYYRRPSTIPQTEINIVEVVKDSIIRDSIYIENEIIKKEIVYVYKQFTQDSINIMSANDSVLFDSFSRYIEDYNNK
jgi:hypothetical protein